MHARRVAKHLARSSYHYFRRVRRQGGSCVVVKIDTHREPSIISNALNRSSKRTRQHFLWHLYWRDSHVPILHLAAPAAAPGKNLGRLTVGGTHVETRCGSPAGKRTTDGCAAAARSAGGSRQSRGHSVRGEPS